MSKIYYAYFLESCTVYCTSQKKKSANISTHMFIKKEILYLPIQGQETFY